MTWDLEDYEVYVKQILAIISCVLKSMIVHLLSR